VPWYGWAFVAASLALAAATGWLVWAETPWMLAALPAWLAWAGGFRLLEAYDQRRERRDE
jgi:hypothetical protein